MPTSEALLASLLLGNKQKPDPIDAIRKQGQTALTAGSEVTPVYSPLQGLARALQGGLGGLTVGYANAKQEEQDTETGTALSKAAQATTPQEIAAALQGIKGNSDMNAVLGQIVQGRLDQTLKQQQAGTALSPYSIGAGGQGGGQGNGWPTITMTKPNIEGQQQAPGSVPAPPSGLDNNVMNIRQSGAPWADKGQPANGFETFNTPQAGANAAAQNFAAYVKADPNITVAQAFAKWAPAGDGANNPNAYVSRVSETTGINPGMKLADVMQNPVDMARLLEAGTGVEKGKAVAGVTPDTFVNAATPVARGAPQMAQAQPQAQPAPQQGSPAGNQLREQARRAQAQGDNVTALDFAKKATEEDAKWATEAGKIQLQGQEHDRQQNTATPNNEQALAASFADRMQNSAGLIDKFGAAGTSLSAKAKDMLPFGIGNLNQSPEYQQYQQARNDFINAQLRRESGAAIAATEYASADKQYFPQPGDGPEVLAQKAKNRALAVEGMVRGSGPAYQPSATVAKPIQQQGGGGDLLSAARDAIAKGAPRDKVLERLRQQGVDAGGL